MSFDNDNAVSAAAAAPAPESPAEETHNEVNSAPSDPAVQSAPAETHAEAPAQAQASAAEPETCQYGKGTVGRRLAEHAKVAHGKRPVEKSREALAQQSHYGAALGRIDDAAGQG